MTTAREDLLSMIFPVEHLDKTHRKLVEEGVDRLLAKHARELAERIRGCNPDRTPDWSDGVDWAADLIDPKTSSA